MVSLAVNMAYKVLNRGERERERERNKAYKVLNRGAKTPWSWGRVYDFCTFFRKGERSNPAANYFLSERP